MSPLLTGIYTDGNGVAREVPISVDATGKMLTATATAPALRTINRATLLNNPTNLQAEFQAAYDAEVGTNAPMRPYQQR